LHLQETGRGALDAPDRRPLEPWQRDDRVGDKLVVSGRHQSLALEAQRCSVGVKLDPVLVEQGPDQLAGGTKHFERLGLGRDEHQLRVCVCIADRAGGEQRELVDRERPGAARALASRGAIVDLPGAAPHQIACLNRFRSHY
jgi:hypothetical protein